MFFIIIKGNFMKLNKFLVLFFIVGSYTTISHTMTPEKANELKARFPNLAKFYKFDQFLSAKIPLTQAPALMQLIMSIANYEFVKEPYKNDVDLQKTALKEYKDLYDMYPKLISSENINVNGMRLHWTIWKQLRNSLPTNIAYPLLSNEPALNVFLKLSDAKKTEDVKSKIINELTEFAQKQYDENKKPDKLSALRDEILEFTWFEQIPAGQWNNWTTESRKIVLTQPILTQLEKNLKELVQITQETPAEGFAEIRTQDLKKDWKKGNFGLDLQTHFDSISKTMDLLKKQQTLTSMQLRLIHIYFVITKNILEFSDQQLQELTQNMRQNKVSSFKAFEESEHTLMESIKKEAIKAAEIKLLTDDAKKTVLTLSDMLKEKLTSLRNSAQLVDKELDNKPNDDAEKIFMGTLMMTIHALGAVNEFLNNVAQNQPAASQQK